jgi:hypothetical protein
VYVVEFALVFDAGKAVFGLLDLLNVARLFIVFMLDVMIL